METLLTPERFAKALESARRPEHGSLHPFSLAWAGGEFTRQQLGQWAIQHHYYVEAIAQQFAALYARLPDLDARRELLEFFHVHIVNDVGHEASGLAIASRYPSTPQLQAQAIAAVRAAAQMRYSMLSGIHASFGLRRAA